MICACRSQPGISIHLAQSTPVASTQYLRKASHLARTTATDSRFACMPHHGAPEESCARPHPAFAHEATTAGARSINASRGACPEENETRCEMHSCSKVVLQSTSCCRRRLCDSVLSAPCGAHSGAVVRQSFAISVRGSSRAARKSQLRQPWQTSVAPSAATCGP